MTSKCVKSITLLWPKLGSFYIMLRHYLQNTRVNRSSLVKGLDE